ncbi:response regulator transcription factor [Larsenimonas suaedae]|uniref:Response regulator transcription factor n=1 Tax=Larsenimonas suaedae TaxID=1851019 RepID=A0ABU1H006_9GAMM|nr:response regulator transcription factor [Larsenimonas suaedae]MCM2972779.1 response regulator transcription factor [Larsenimonas suaedae]MDR5896878.1 response regulator transcription factor [Larsenimonas suaedae]
MALLLIEDDALLAQTLTTLLTGEGREVDHLADGNAALACIEDAAAARWELLVLDLNLPGASGLEILERFRALDAHTPVLILTARAEVTDRVRGLDLGADDYMTKPFAIDEFDARVRALLRRRGTLAPHITLGPLRLDTASHTFTLDEAPLNLPPREQRLLACLMRHHGSVIDRATLIREAFGDDETLKDGALDVYLHRLRKRLPGDALLLKTVRGFGYLLDTP